jgi:hypothetical protein
MTKIMRLTRSMYGGEFDHRDVSDLFGLHCGQIRCREVHNPGWYNKLGEKLGWGDLNADDFLRIACELEPDELFIVLCEENSYWNFVCDVGLIGGMSRASHDVNAPGIEYVTKHVMYIIAPCKLYAVAGKACLSEPGTVLDNWYIGMQFDVISQKQAEEMIKKS